MLPHPTKTSPAQEVINFINLVDPSYVIFIISLSYLSLGEEFLQKIIMHFHLYFYLYGHAYLCSENQEIYNFAIGGPFLDHRYYI